jgi:hypothetical protein
VIAISRRLWSAEIRTVFFADVPTPDAGEADLVAYVQTSSSVPGLAPIRTLHIDLTREPGRLFAGFGQSTRNQINRASREEGLGFIAVTEPAADDIAVFQQFYNVFARSKGTTLCDAYNLETLRLLAGQKGLVLTRLCDAASEPLCYHAYVVDGHRAMLLYSASHFRSAENAARRSALARANRLLHWRDILYFRDLGLRIYDCGGLTEDPRIAEFKRSFGGDEVSEFTGYVSGTWKGKAALKARALLYELRYGIGRARRRHERNS